jgi:hypothetical protein
MHMNGQPVNRWRQVPDNAVIFDGKIYPIGDEVTTYEASRILGVSPRRVQAMCDEGILAEGRDWRRNMSRSGTGHYRIRRSALKPAA